MFEPIRGGTRGGQAEFKWSDVSADKDRENYLGHSINAPTGRWQKNKDVHWYSRDSAGTEAERAEEIRKIKELEAEAMSVALGFGPSQKGTTSTTPGPATGANATAPKPDADAEATGASKAAEKEDKQRRKAKRKEEKQARKEQRRAARAIQREQSLDYARRDRRPRDPSRSRSPPRRRTYNDDDHRHPPLQRYSRSRSPLPSRSGYRDDRYDRGRTDHQRRS